MGGTAEFGRGLDRPRGTRTGDFGILVGALNFNLCPGFYVLDSNYEKATQFSTGTTASWILVNPMQMLKNLGID